MLIVSELDKISHLYYIFVKDLHKKQGNRGN